MGSLKLHWSKFVLWSFLSITYTAFVASSFNAYADDNFNITCQYDEECSAAVNGSLCDVERQCYCPEEIPIFVHDSKKNSSFCLKSLNITDKGCVYSQQCNYEHSACWKRTCSCAPRYRIKEGTCQEKSPLVPIVVGSVLAAIIVITLIAYYVISRRKTEEVS